VGGNLRGLRHFLLSPTSGKFRLGDLGAAAQLGDRLLLRGDRLVLRKKLGFLSRLTLPQRPDLDSKALIAAGHIVELLGEPAQLLRHRGERHERHPGGGLTGHAIGGLDRLGTSGGFRATRSSAAIRARTTCSETRTGRLPCTGRSWRRTQSRAARSLMPRSAAIAGMVSQRLPGASGPTSGGGSGDFRGCSLSMPRSIAQGAGMFGGGGCMCGTRSGTGSDPPWCTSACYRQGVWVYVWRPVVARESAGRCTRLYPAFGARTGHPWHYADGTSVVTSTETPRRWGSTERW